MLPRQQGVYGIAERSWCLQQVRVRIDRLLGRLPVLQHARQAALDGDADACPPESRAPALYVVAALCALGEVLTLPARSPYAPASADGCTWGAWLAFPVKARAHA